MAEDIVFEVTQLAADRVTLTERLVLFVLAHRADGNGVCAPSQSALAYDCGVSARTTQRTCQALAEKGLLEIEACHRDDGARAPNRLTVLPL